MRDLWYFYNNQKRTWKWKKKQLITRILFSFFILSVAGVKSTIFYGWFVFCLQKKTLEKSKKLQIKRKISFNFLLGGPPRNSKIPRSSLAKKYKEILRVICNFYLKN